jgi:hypothetical protein
MMIKLLTVFLAGLPSVAADSECVSGSFYFAKFLLFCAFSTSSLLQSDNTFPPSAAYSAIPPRYYLERQASPSSTLLTQLRVLA